MSKPSKPPSPSSSSPSSKLLRVTLEGAVMSAISNILAQTLKFYQEGSSAVDPVTFLHFIILAIITTPPNYQWQLWLEKTFPSNPPAKVAQSEKKKDDDVPGQKEKGGALSVTNTVAKFVLDQTCGATFNTVWFIVMINLLRGNSWNHILSTVQNDFVPMIMAGYKFWPVVSLVNLAIVPFDQRMLVGGLAGLAWGIYVSLTQL